METHIDVACVDGVNDLDQGPQRSSLYSRIFCGLKSNGTQRKSETLRAVSNRHPAHTHRRSLDFIQQRNSDVVAAATGPNYHDPALADRVIAQMNVLLIVTGLIVGGVYGGLYTGNTTDTPIGHDHHIWFAWCNYVAFGFAVVAALMALGNLMAWPALPRWPPDWHTLPPAPPALVELYVDSFDFCTVSECAQALNFAWHACNLGCLPPRYRRLLDINVKASYYFLTTSVLFALTASIISLAVQMSGPSAAKFVAAGIVITLGPPLLLQLLPYVAADGRTLPQMCRIYWSTDFNNLDLVLQSWRQYVEKAVQCSSKDANKALFDARVWYEAAQLAAHHHTYLPTISAAAGYQVEMEAEYIEKVRPVMATLAGWQQQHGPHYAVHVFMSPLLASQAASLMQTLHRFWHRWQALLTAGAFTADQFFSSSETDCGAVWLSRARRFRLLAEPLFIARWYYNDRHYRPRARTPPPGPYFTSAIVQPGLTRVSLASAATTVGSSVGKSTRRVSRLGEEQDGSRAGVAGGGVEDDLGVRQYRPREYFAIIWEQEQREAAELGGEGEGGLLQVMAGAGPPLQPSLELEFLLEHHLGGGRSVRFQDMPLACRQAVQLVGCRGCEQGVPSGSNALAAEP